MKVWIKRCREPGELTWTLVPYVSNREIEVNTKFRPSVVSNLLRGGCGVYGGCEPVQREVARAVKRLHGRRLDESLLTWLHGVCNQNVRSGSLVFCRSRNYREIMRWLSYELSRGNISRNDRLSWKQMQRERGEW